MQFGPQFEHTSIKGRDIGSTLVAACTLNPRYGPRFLYGLNPSHPGADIAMDVHLSRPKDSPSYMHYVVVTLASKSRLLSFLGQRETLSCAVHYCMANIRIWGFFNWAIGKLAVAGNNKESSEKSMIFLAFLLYKGGQ